MAYLALGNDEEALRRLQASALAAGIELHAAQPHHVRSWVAQLRTRGLAPRSIAIALFLYALVRVVMLHFS